MKKFTFYLLLLLIPYNSLAYKEAAIGPSYSDFGGIGLLQMPNARMAAEGTLSLNANRTSPYSRYSTTFQPFPWTEATIRYTSISGVAYDASGTISDSSYLDRALDVKFRILEESRYVPEVAVGLRDLGGTGLFSAEYITASKRFGAVDFTLGVGWGYLGSRIHASNPFGSINSRFDTRPTGGGSGSFNTGHYFHGPIAFFGGLEYQTPYRPLRFKLEYDANDYSNEPHDAVARPAKSPINFGLVYRLGKNVDLTLGYERGDEIIFGLAFSENLKNLKSALKFDLPNIPVVNPELVPPIPPANWQPVVHELKNVGIVVERIYLNQNEITIYAEFTKSYHHAELLGLASRVLANHLPANIKWFNFVERNQGLSINETSIKRDYFVLATAGRVSQKELMYATEQIETYSKYDPLVYKAVNTRFNFGLKPGLRAIYGGPDDPFLYQLTANLSASFKFTPALELSGLFIVGLADNYDKYVYDAPAGTGVAIPRVRTLTRDYVKGSDAWIENLQLTYTRRLSRNWFAMGYGGLLEQMYGGVGGEVLYRPHGSRLALGFDINHVKQRKFKRRFGFRDYKVTTGHATAYYNWKEKGVLIKASAGRYLGKDIGLTLDISRKFKNGVTAGIFATKTDVSSAEFGEGSFDKGIYINIPFDYISPFRSRAVASFAWKPLTRDGGAKLSRKYSLYGITKSRELDDLYDGFDNAVGPIGQLFQ